MIVQRTLIALILLLPLFCIRAESDSEYKPIEDLDIDSYLGRWYQTHASFNFVLLELGGICTTADYTLASNNTIALVNQGRNPLVPTFFQKTTGLLVRSPEGDARGTVYQTYNIPVIGEALDELGINQIYDDVDEVSYESPGNYWVIAIGPIVDGQYQWAAISNPDKTLSFIIARDVDEFYNTYEDEALQVFEDFGFTDFFRNKPLETPHVGCGDY